LKRALTAHERLPMPIERARTLLILGRIRRRLRKRRAAKEALDEALEIFDLVGSPRWAEQARTEIDAIGLRPVAEGDELTPAETRVADLVAKGMSNKEVAAALVVTPKTVEAHLGRIYRKLEIRRRSELTALMAKREEGSPAPAD
jgi:DNA-binding CsgD family transcriptional regulator